MLITSSWHDYYDSASAHGVDKTIVFSRKEEILEEVTEFSKFSGRAQVRFKNGQSYSAHNFWIGFCGRWYFGRSEFEHIKKGFYGGYEERFYFGTEAIDRAYPSKGKYSWFDSTKKNREFVLMMDGAWKLDLFLKHDAPILFVEGNTLKKNPQLSAYKFQRVIDAFTAFQSIEQFLTGPLAKQVDPAPLSDKSRIVAHGFDLKTSFRNSEPPKRKRK